MAIPRLEKGIWVLVADGEKALFLRNVGDAVHPSFQVFHEVENDNPPTREQGTDQPGRYFDAGMPNRSGYEMTDWHRIGKERFAEILAERLYKHAHAGEFKKLIIVAPPLVLGKLRKELHKVVADRVVEEIPKTLTNHATWDIEELLKSAVEQ